MNHLIYMQNISKGYSYANYLSRTIFTSATNMEKAVKEVKKNPFYDKYSDKINKMKEQSPERFIERASKVTASNSSNFSTMADQSKAPLECGEILQTKKKKLEDIMRIDLLKDMTADEIKYIWAEYFSKKVAICGIMPTSLYEKMQSTASKYPTFLFPLTKDSGYEFILSQFAQNEIHFSSLINYQAYQQNAPENLSIVHYTEFSKDKDIVLMHGEVNEKVLSCQEAQFLANQVQLYYTGNDESKIKLLETFTNNPESFNHMELISQIENIDLGKLAKK